MFLEYWIRIRALESGSIFLEYRTGSGSGSNFFGILDPDQDSMFLEYWIRIRIQSFGILDPEQDPIFWEYWIRIRML
jgi:hypothetical protein